MKRPPALSLLFARSRSFNLHLSRLLLLLVLVYFAVLANVSGCIWPFLRLASRRRRRRRRRLSRVEHARTYISSAIRKRPTDRATDGEKEEKERKVEDYVCYPDRLSSSLIQLGGQSPLSSSSSSSLRERHICSIVVVASNLFFLSPSLPRSF